MIHSRKLGKIGNKAGSFYITLPADEVRRLGWREGQYLFVRRSAKGKRLVVELANYKPSKFLK